jgi:hypothetical protein
MQSICCTSLLFFVFKNFNFILIFIILEQTGIFVMEHAGAPFLKLSKGSKPERRSRTFPGIGFRKLVAYCYPTVLVSNKLAYFVQFLKEKLTPL